MWISMLCGFPPLIPETDIDLENPGIVLNTTFEVSVEKSYVLLFSFYFPTDQDRVNDHIIGRYDQYCKWCLTECDPNNIIRDEEDRKLYGKVIPVRIIVRKLSDSTIVIDKTFQTMCSIAAGTNDKIREIGWIKLAEGKFSLEIINISGQPELKGIQTKIMLAAGYGK